ncbi:MAG: DUF4365 domain-containing protein [Acidobacteriota bacterium]
MKRPQQHITDTLGEAQMRAIFEPLGWTVNKVEGGADYGHDFEVEVFRDFESTGIAFKVQLKSSNSTQYSKNKKFISEKIDFPNVKRLCNEIRGPVILIHADCESHQTFWSAPQLDSHLAKTLSAKDQKKVTVRIPASQELPATIADLIKTITQVVEQVLASRILMSTPVTDFVGLVKDHLDEDAITRTFKDKIDAIKLMKAQEQMLSGFLDDAKNTMQKVIDDDESSIEMKFWAYLWFERAEKIRLVRANAHMETWPKLKLSVSRQLQELTKKGPSHLKFFALIARKAAELDLIVHKDWGLYLNWKLHEKSVDLFWKAQLVFERSNSFRKIVRSYNHCIRLARYAANSKDSWALSLALLRIVEAISIFIMRLSKEGQNEIADQYSSSSLQLCRLAAWIAEQNSDDDALFYCIVAALPLKRDPNSDAWNWALKTVKLIKKQEAKENAQKMIDSHTRRISGEYIEGDIKTTRKQVYENMASGLGIDLSDPTDLEAEIVRIGLKDLDPSRVLKNCEHLFVSAGLSAPPIAVLLQMPSAGEKIIHCTLHRYAISGLLLDNIYNFFKQRYCDHCPDCSPRPSTWECSEEWIKEEEARRTEYMESFRKRL